MYIVYSLDTRLHVPSLSVAMVTVQSWSVIAAFRAACSVVSGHCCMRALLIQGTNTPWLCGSSHVTPGCSVVIVHTYTLTQWHKHSMVVW